MTQANLARSIVEAAYLEGEFVLSSGQTSRYYLDKYLFSTQPRLLKPIAEALAKLVPAGTQALYGVELGAVPLVTALALETDLPFGIVRKSSKGYGTSKLIEGTQPKGLSVALVEDVLTTAGQAIRAAEILRDLGAQVKRVIYVVDREQGAAQNIRNAGFEPAYVFSKTILGI